MLISKLSYAIPLYERIVDIGIHPRRNMCSNGASRADNNLKICLPILFAPLSLSLFICRHYIYRRKPRLVALVSPRTPCNRKTTDRSQNTIINALTLSFSLSPFILPLLTVGAILCLYIYRPYKSPCNRKKETKFVEIPPLLD